MIILNFELKDKDLKMKINQFIILIILLFSNLTAVAGQTIKIGSLELKRWTTSQGMQVLFAHSSELPMLDLRLVFDAGGARDGDLPGIAKLTNALIYEGVNGLSGQKIAETFEGLGVQYGNGSYRDMAVLDFRSLSEQKVIAKTLDTINLILAKPLFEQKTMDRELNKMRIALKLEQENPSSKANLAFYKTLYTSHPYASPTNGNKNSLNKITREDLLDYYKKYYVASNTILAVVGDISLKQVEQLAERLSQTLTQGEHAPMLPEVNTDKQGQLIKITHPSTQTSIIIGTPVLKRGDKDYYALYLGNHILGGSGFSSRLVKEVRVKQGLSYSVASSFSQMRAKGPFQISLTTKNSTADQAITLVNQVVSQFIKEGPTGEELNQAKLNISGSFPLRTKSNKDIVEHLAVIGFYNLAENYLDIFKQKIENVSLEDINETFQRRLDLSKLSTIVVGNVVDK